MSQQPDLTIPFDASVLDEEALRALRAVQRMLPTGDGGASGNLVGGTEAVAAFGMVPGAPSGTVSVRPHEIAVENADRIASRDEAPPSGLDIAPSNNTPLVIDAALSDDTAPSMSQAPRTSLAPRVAVSSGSSGYVPETAASAVFSPQIVDAGADRPDDQVAVPQPPADEPAAEEPRDVTADAPLVQANNAEGQEDQPIALNLSAILADTDGSELLTIKIFGVPEGATLTHGKRQSDGSWSVSPADLPDLGDRSARELFRQIQPHPARHVAGIQRRDVSVRSDVSGAGPRRRRCTGRDGRRCPWPGGHGREPRGPRRRPARYGRFGEPQLRDLRRSGRSDAQRRHLARRRALGAHARAARRADADPAGPDVGTVHSHAHGDRHRERGGRSERPHLGFLRGEPGPGGRCRQRQWCEPGGGGHVNPDSAGLPDV